MYHDIINIAIESEGKNILNELLGSQPVKRQRKACVVIYDLIADLNRLEEQISDEKLLKKTIRLFVQERIRTLTDLKFDFKVYDYLRGFIKTIGKDRIRKCNKCWLIVDEQYNIHKRHNNTDTIKTVLEKLQKGRPNKTLSIISIKQFKERKQYA